MERDAKEKITPTQLLQLIEHFAGSYEAESVEIDIAEGRPVTEREREMAEQINFIYRFSHAFNCHICQPVHEDWRKEAEEMYTTLIHEKPEN